MKIFIALFCLGQGILATQPNLSCDNPVYCPGGLLHAVQMAKIFSDAKTFVDLKQKNGLAITLNNFRTIMNHTDDNPSPDQLRTFIKDNFESGNELDPWSMPDYNGSPAFLEDIKSMHIREFARAVVKLWPTLARKTKTEIGRLSSQYSIIPLPNGFIIPGGRYKELRSWNSYWILEGLLLCGMNETAKGMLDNFMHMVHKYGFLPSGGRTYLLSRAAPPMLTLMVDLYIKATRDFDWLRENIDALDDELHFWLNNRTIQILKKGVNYTLARYDVKNDSPRPEHYTHDVEVCAPLQTEEKIKQCYAALASASESGWDFSSRWLFDKRGGNEANLTSINTKRVVPVDLNAFLAKSFITLSTFYSELNDKDRTSYWLSKYLNWLQSIDQILYNRQDGIWYDYDLEFAKQRVNFFPSNMAPLWAEIYSSKILSASLGLAATTYLKNQGILNYRGGSPASFINSGEQWDFPNAWPPLQALIILGLDRSGDSSAKEVASILAKKWVEATMTGFNETHAMFEKYDSVNAGKYGVRGEYEVQIGFGWTNGIALKLINDFFRNP